MSTHTIKKNYVAKSAAISKAAAESLPADPGNVGKRMAGTYLLKESVEGDGRVLLRLITVMRDGSWISCHGHQHSKEFAFTNQQGVWQATGPREITAKVIDFNYNPNGGELTAVSRIGFVMQMSEDYREVRGEMFGERYHLNQDPLNPNEVCYATFGNTFAGRRVMVDE